LHFKKSKIFSETVVLTEFSPTATVNLLLALSRYPKAVTIHCASQDYPVLEVCWFLKKLGVSIEGIGTHTVTVTGSTALGGTTYTVMPDPIEVGTFISLAAATRSNITITGTVPEFLRLELELFKKVGVGVDIRNRRNGPHNHYELADLAISSSGNYAALKKVHNMPAPGFIPDLLPPLSVLLTQAHGTSLIHDWMYEGRLRYLTELIKMGANAHILNPHQAIIIGPTTLFGKTITSYDIRAGATLIIAALTAEGESEIRNIYQIDRGYEAIDKRLAALGAHIERVR
jgi:UDP-N-acetylglucosamine 1-carboxyvinyltransferase